jgi:hypothetical protein
MNVNWILFADKNKAREVRHTHIATSIIQKIKKFIVACMLSVIYGVNMI